MTSSIAFENRAGRAYSQLAFRHFLQLERARSGRGTRNSRLLVVRPATPDGKVPGLSAAEARVLFDSLLSAVRDTDIVGWLHEGRLAGAILSDRADALDATVEAGGRRVREAVEGRLAKLRLDGYRLRITKIYAKTRKAGP